jgi:hypothetical protein
MNSSFKEYVKKIVNRIIHQDKTTNWWTLLKKVAY